MYQRINQHAFIEAFRTMGRYDRQDGQGGNFTYEALVALFDYLEGLEDGLYDDEHPGLQLDPIGLCCEFAEYESIEDAASEYDHDDTVADLLADYATSRRHEQSGEQPADEMEAERDNIRAELLEWFRDQTTVIAVPGTNRIIIQQF